MLALVALLAVSNLFMTLAWFLHLRHPAWPLWQAILISWVIALAEYAVAIPAVRAAYERDISPTTIKVTQEAVTLAMFAVVIGLIVSHTGLNWRFAVAVALLLAAVWVVHPVAS